MNVGWGASSKYPPATPMTDAIDGASNTQLTEGGGYDPRRTQVRQQRSKMLGVLPDERDDFSCDTDWRKRQ